MPKKFKSYAEYLREHKRQEKLGIQHRQLMQERRKTCQHPSIEVEKIMGRYTNEYLCTECETCFITYKEWEEYRKSRGLNT